MSTLLGDNLDDVAFAAARWQAEREALRATLVRQRKELLPFDAVRSRFLVRGQYDGGIQMVPLDQIVGSQGRYADFDRHFRPRTAHTEERWKRVSRARRRNVELPPIELYKLGGVYFVADGNHRVSVARQAGQLDIQGRVTELSIDVSLTPDLDLAGLIRKEEQADFFEWTNLKRLRPDCQIEVTGLGGYLELIRHINWQRACLAAIRGADPSSDEAVLDWYDTVYTPLVTAIRASNALRAFPGRTETDLYIWVMEHGQDLLQVSSAGRLGPGRLRDLLRRFRGWRHHLLGRR